MKTQQNHKICQIAIRRSVWLDMAQLPVQSQSPEEDVEAAVDEAFRDWVGNKFQTPLTDELKGSLPKEVWDDMLEYIATVPMIDHLISEPEVRGYAKDRPRDEDGKIIVDLSKPHILEDMDYFREAAIFFDKNNRYTNLMPNSNPNSEYALFWKQELKRWKHGMVRESDGEWIPGQLYFYWNYSPIWLVEESKSSNDSKKTRGERLRKFPKPWLGDYLFYHYME